MTIAPNAYQTPNLFVDRAMELLDESELRCLVFATRHILGWQGHINERRNRISLATFEHGFTTKNGYRCAGCGLGKQAIIDALDRLVTFGFLIKVGEPTPKGQEWELNDDGIDWPALEARHASLKEASKKRTAKATAAALLKRGGTSDVPGQGGTSDVTGSGTSDVTGSGTSDVLNQSHGESHGESHDKDSTAQGAAWQGNDEEITFIDGDHPPVLDPSNPQPSGTPPVVEEIDQGKSPTAANGSSSPGSGDPPSPKKGKKGEGKGKNGKKTKNESPYTPEENKGLEEVFYGWWHTADIVARPGLCNNPSVRAEALALFKLGITETLVSTYVKGLRQTKKYNQGQPIEWFVITSGIIPYLKARGLMPNVAKPTVPEEDEVTILDEPLSPDEARKRWNERKLAAAGGAS